MTKTPKIEVHGSIVFTEDGPQIRVNGHAYGDIPVVGFDLAYDFVRAVNDALNEASKPGKVYPFKRGRP